MGTTSDQKGEDRAEEKRGGGVSRRSFLQTMGLAAGAVAVPLNLRTSEAQSANTGLGPGSIKYKLKINGKSVDIDAEPRLTLAQVLRDKLDMTGTKVVCDRGACGGCTVIIDKQSVNSCMLLAIDARDKEITTIEGLAKADGTLDPVQEGFIEHDGMQCGYCTPGLIMRSRALLDENPHPTLEQIKHGLAGNICRCGTYTHVFAAVMSASKKGA